MVVPRVDEPARYRGLYVYDFGEWTAVGYTAEEVAILLEDPKYRGGRVYKIHRASPDGQFELRGVSGERFELESGMFFYRAELDAAREDYRGLCDAAEDSGLPCRAFVQLADRLPAAGAQRYVTALVYPAEHDDEVSRWLLDRGFTGGDVAEGGISHVTNYYHEEKTVLARRQLASRYTSRPAEEVLANVRRAVQR